MADSTPLLTDPFDGFLLGKRYLLHNRDTKFTPAFDALLKDYSVEPIFLPPRSPNLNTHCERFVRSIMEEALTQMLLLGERSLYYVVQQYFSAGQQRGVVNLAPPQRLASRETSLRWGGACDTVRLGVSTRPFCRPVNS